jgi:copper chaperone
MTTVTIRVPGIHCDHCKSSIEGALGEVPGVRTAEVSVDDRNVTVDYDEAAVALDVLHDAIVEQGYDLAQPE